MDWFYKNREERSKWLVERFYEEISNSNSLLDVGCFNADLKKYLPEAIKYIGVDIAGKPDVFIDLDKIDRLPFDNNQFDTVVCADVLEHLENIHLVFDELCRVASKNLIITLPNAYASIPEFLIGKKYTDDSEKRKKYGKHSKFYGLPLEKPEDRHRWFFSFDEAIDFLKNRANKFDFYLDVIESENQYKRMSFIRKLGFYLLRKFNKNLTERNVIVLLKKR